MTFVSFFSDRYHFFPFIDPFTAVYLMLSKYFNLLIFKLIVLSLNVATPNHNRTCTMKKYLLPLLLIVALQCAHAQTAHLSFDHLNITQGLPDNYIQDMVQDKQGYMWIATVRGIVRYDGYRVKAYKPGAEDKTNVPVYLFSNTFLDKNHDLWANSVTSGLYKYDPSADHFVQYKN